MNALQNGKMSQKVGNPSIYKLKINVSYMNQNCLKHILNRFVKIMEFDMAIIWEIQYLFLKAILYFKLCNLRKTFQYSGKEAVVASLTAIPSYIPVIS